jgi:fumarylpyruvate hydrolase
MPDSGEYAFAPTITSVEVVESRKRFPVRRVYCVGRNYVAHIREMKEADERDPPFFFQKPADAIVANGTEIEYPPDTGDFQYEVELVVALGRGGRNINVGHALSHVFGYAVGLDMTRRDRQRDARDRRLPWEMGKSFDQSAPCAALHEVSDVGHPGSGAITLSVNGRRTQEGDLSQMIWNVPEIIANLSAQYELCAGDLIFTGTPAGVGPVVAGDEIHAAIAGLQPLAVKIGSRRT